MPLLKIKTENNILRITLSDPATKNALSPALVDEFHTQIKKNNLQAVLVDAQGSVFCSGGNLRFYKNLATKDEGLAYNQKIREILQSFSDLPIVKVALVKGLCVGGGLEFLSCFNHVIATPSSLFGMWQRRVGLTYGWGGQERLEKRISANLLQNWLLSGATYSAYLAQGLGLVNQIQLSANLLPTGLKWIENCQKYGSESVEKILENPGDQTQVFGEIWHSQRHRQVLDSFR